MNLQFVVSYDLCSTYKDDGVGEWHSYKIRDGVHPSLHKPESLPAIVMTVGTVMNEYRGHGEFPPEEVVRKLSDLRNGVRYFGAKWDEKYEKIFYNVEGQAVSSEYFRTTVQHQGDVIWYKPYFDMMP